MNCEKIGAPTVKRFAKYTLLVALAGSLVAGPVHAQAQRDGYKFLDAVKERNGTEATQLLSEPGNVLVNSRDITSGETALHIVTQRRDPVWLRFLLAKGANPNIADRKGTTPLQLAAQLGFVEGVEILAEFTDSFHPRLIGMTGTKEQIDAVTEAFAAVYSIEEPNEAGGYLVGHTNITYLFGPDGEPLAMLPTDQGPEAVAAELDKWVR